MVRIEKLSKQERERARLQNENLKTWKPRIYPHPSPIPSFSTIFGKYVRDLGVGRGGGRSSVSERHK
eukprot:4780525-Amphidinium_carterae.1